MTDTNCPGWDDFAEKEGCAFTIESDEARHEFKLESVTGFEGSARPGGSFRLLFIGPRDPILPQSIYRISTHDCAWDIFLVPVSRDENGTHYEAIFN